MHTATLFQELSEFVIAEGVGHIQRRLPILSFGVDIRSSIQQQLGDLDRHAPQGGWAPMLRGTWLT